MSHIIFEGFCTLWFSIMVLTWGNTNWYNLLIRLIWLAMTIASIIMLIKDVIR